METLDRGKTDAGISEAEYTEAQRLAVACVEVWFASLASVPASIELDDLRTEAWLAVQAARETWDPARSSFTTYAQRMARWHCQKCLRRHGQRNTYSLETEPEVLAVDPFGQADTRLVAEHLLAQLQPSVRLILMEYHAGDSQQQIAERHGMSQNGVSRQIRRGLARLRAVAAR
jgi:RNA polymerase sigma factor (sigma-70 family)